MDVIGKATINPFVFYTGKIAGYVCWAVSAMFFFNVLKPAVLPPAAVRYASTFFLFAGAVFTVVSMINLGASTRLGLPDEKTVLKSGGLYRISRNPMYLGFDLFTISAILSTLNIFVLLAGIYSIITYHFIILGEERFLEKRFGEEYAKYKKQAPRYLFL